MSIELMLIFGTIYSVVGIIAACITYPVYGTSEKIWHIVCSPILIFLWPFFIREILDTIDRESP